VVNFCIVVLAYAYLQAPNGISAKDSHPSAWWNLMWSSLAIDDLLAFPR